MYVFVFAFTSEYAAQKIKAKAGFALDAFFSSSMLMCCGVLFGIFESYTTTRARG